MTEEERERRFQIGQQRRRERELADLGDEREAVADFRASFTFRLSSWISGMSICLVALVVFTSHVGTEWKRAVVSDVIDGTKKNRSKGGFRRGGSKLTSARFVDFEERRIEIPVGSFRATNSGDTVDILVTPFFNHLRAISSTHEIYNYGYNCNRFLFILAFFSVVTLLIPPKHFASIPLRYFVLFVSIPVVIYSLTFDSCFWQIFQPIGF